MPKVKAIHQLVIDGQVIVPGKTVNVAKEHLDRLVTLGAVTLATGEVAEDAVVTEAAKDQVAQVAEGSDAPAEEKSAKGGKSAKKSNDDLV